MALSVRKRTPALVLTMLPLGIEFELVGSRLSKRTAPFALVSSMRLPVAGKLLLASSGTVSWRAGTVSVAGSGSVAVVLATIRREAGPTVAWRGVTTAVALGRNRKAPAPATTSASASTASPTTSGVRPIDQRRPLPAVLGPRAHWLPLHVGGGRCVGHDARGRDRRGGTRRAFHLTGGRGLGRAGCARARDRGGGGRVASRSGRFASRDGRGTDSRDRGRVRAVRVGRLRDGVRYDLASTPRPRRRRGHRFADQHRFIARSATERGKTAGRRHRARRRHTAAGPGRHRPGRRRRRGPARGIPSAPSSDDSYSATVEKTGNPADAASARVAGSAATTERILPFVIASRASSRKLIRDVATREPYGNTTATRVASAARMRAAAEVISSSTSR